MECSDSERRRLASASVAWNLSQPEFTTLFPDFAELREEELLRRARPRNAGLIARGALDEAGLPGAAAAKATGDAFFRAKAYDKAIGAYTLALEAAPGSPASSNAPLAMSPALRGRARRSNSSSRSSAKSGNS